MSVKELNKVAGYRTMIGLSQKEMARHLDISPQSYSNKERGYRPFSDHEKIKIKELFSKSINNLTIDSLFF